MGDLLWAVERNNFEEVKKLLEKQELDINYEDIYRRTSLHNACRHGYLQILQVLLRDHRINVNKQDEFGYTPFYLACQWNHIEIVKCMMQDHRVDVNMQDKYGWSPLIPACKTGKKQIVRLLIASGRKVDIDQETTRNDYLYDTQIKSGSTALDVAKQWNHTEIIQILKNYQSNPTETQQNLRNQMNLKGK